MLRGNLLKLAKGYSRSSITHTVFKKSLPFSNAIISRTIGVAKFSTSETPNGSDKEAASAAASRKEVSKFDPDEYDDYDEPKTAGEKVRTCNRDSSMRLDYYYHYYFRT